MPSGRCGGREDLFTALQQARAFLKDMHLDVLSIVANGNDGVLESNWTARKPDGKSMSARLICFFTNENGLIVKEHDYSVLAAS